MESQIAFVFLSNFSDQSLEWKFSDEELSRFLELSDFTESNGTWSESVRFFDSADVMLVREGCGLTRSLIGKLLSWGFCSSGFAGGLLGSCHFIII